MMELGTDKRYLYCFFGMFFAVHPSRISDWSVVTMTLVEVCLGLIHQDLPM